MGWGVEPPTKFSKKGEVLDKISIFRVGLLVKRAVVFFKGWGCSFYIKNMKYLMTKKSINKNAFLCHN